jgi:hypothetical protein
VSDEDPKAEAPHWLPAALVVGVVLCGTVTAVVGSLAYGVMR